MIQIVRTATTIRTVECLTQDRWRRTDQATLAEEVGVSRRQINTILASLIELGVIEVRRPHCRERCLEYRVNEGRRLELDLT